MAGKFFFPEWVNRARSPAVALLAAAAVYVVLLVYCAGSPTTIRVGYAPEQPVAFSHALHAGELGLDCRYCHTTVETAAHAAVPSTNVCMNCHTAIAPTSQKLTVVRDSAADGQGIHWIRVHDTPDYVYFNHAAHVQRGVSCVSCHGRVDRMERVTQVEPLSMAWCLECHRDPAPHIRPLEFVTDLSWDPSQIGGPDATELGRELIREHGIRPSTDCSTCHR